MASAKERRYGLVTATLLSVGLIACGHRRSDEPALSRASSPGEPALDVPVPAANGPKLGSIANVTLVLDRPTRGARAIGYLHAGASVARAARSYGNAGCQGGWFPIRPRGFVCSGESATLDLMHPTLAAMAVQPKLDAALPYTYARTRVAATVYAQDPDRPGAIRKVATLPRGSGAAIVGSWSAADEGGVRRRLALLTDGRFLETADLRAIKVNDFKGVALGSASSLPVGFVVKRDAVQWTLDGDHAAPDRALGFHDSLAISGRQREIGDDTFWQIGPDAWVRARDVRVIEARTDFPDFVDERTHWIDVGVLAGTVVLYEGKTPVYASLVSVGRDRMGEPGSAAATARGDFPIVYKQVTAAATDPARFASDVEILDAPWTLELSSGQLIYGAFWHNRFGVAHGPGNLELSPLDAAYVWHWVTPELPEGWHGVAVDSTSARTLVSIHK